MSSLPISGAGPPADCAISGAPGRPSLIPRLPLRLSRFPLGGYYHQLSPPQASRAVQHVKFSRACTEDSRRPRSGGSQQQLICPTRCQAMMRSHLVWQGPGCRPLRANVFLPGKPPARPGMAACLCLAGDDHGRQFLPPCRPIRTTPCISG